jgi:hypothetical protein
VSFNLMYLSVVWVLVVLMFRGLRKSASPAIGRRFAYGFLLLALGDTGHVGFRVWAFARGGLDATVSFAGFTIPLVGAGALATAITVTLLYVLLLDAWRVGTRRAPTLVFWVLLGVAAIRLVVFLFPQNQWGQPVPPFTWSLLRNALLTVLGLSVAWLFWRDGRKQNLRTWVLIAYTILCSYAFYAPVVLWVQRAPAIGMLMIPKTIAYVVLGIIAYRAYCSAPHGAVAADRLKTASGLDR